MSVQKTYGAIRYNDITKKWKIAYAQPHVWIKLKAAFNRIPKAATSYDFEDTPENCADIDWFMQRYPFEISESDVKRIKKQKKKFENNIAELERILLPDYIPGEVKLKEGFEIRKYQGIVHDLFFGAQRFILGDEFGLGKTLTSLLPALDKRTRPALVVVQAHLAFQWKEKGVEQFTDLNAHIINGGKIYDLPKADIYIIRYTVLAKWINVLCSMGIKYVIFDECQELRRIGKSEREKSLKYEAAEKISEVASYVQGLSGSPIYNYGVEMYNIFNVIKPGALGSRGDFVREWCKGYGAQVADPQALGSYLREKHLFIRRTREEVGLELPQINKIIHTVDYDDGAVQREEDILRHLAMKVLDASDKYSNEANMEFDMRMRQITGIAKAKEVAAFVKLILENDEPVLLGGWHRGVYEIWEEEFAIYKPVWYTGHESPRQKNTSVEDFISGKSKLLIMSNRSGPGVDGLQDVCSFVVFGELDHSPKVHDQFIARVDRPGQKKPVTATFAVSDFGSDPVMLDRLGVKSSQSHGIIDPFKVVSDQHSDDRRIKEMAKSYIERLNKKSVA